MHKNTELTVFKFFFVLFVFALFRYFGGPRSCYLSIAGIESQHLVL